MKYKSCTVSLLSKSIFPINKGVQPHSSSMARCSLAVQVESSVVWVEKEKLNSLLLLCCTGINSH